jgi:tripartite-type tricarboxylate transporter receptor subunit TctC
VTTTTRSEMLPDIPTVPNHTPAEIIDGLNKEINAGLADPTMKARFADLGSAPMPMTSADFGKLIADETEKGGKVVKFAGITPD